MKLEQRQNPISLATAEHGQAEVSEYEKLREDFDSLYARVEIMVPKKSSPKGLMGTRYTPSLPVGEFEFRLAIFPGNDTHYSASVCAYRDAPPDELTGEPVRLKPQTVRRQNLDPEAPYFTDKKGETARLQLEQLQASVEEFEVMASNLSQKEARNLGFPNEYVATLRRHPEISVSSLRKFGARILGRLGIPAPN